MAASMWSTVVATDNGTTTSGSLWTDAAAASTAVSTNGATWHSGNVYMSQSVPAVHTIPTPAVRRQEFNKYVNASDLLEQFIKDMDALGLTQEEFLTLPVNAFITWLIMKAAVADGESAMWRCASCGRFTKEGLVACNSNHARKLLLAA